MSNGKQWTELSADDHEDFEWASDNTEGLVKSQHRYFRRGNVLIEIHELNRPNYWDHERFDAEVTKIMGALNGIEAE